MNITAIDSCPWFDVIKKPSCLQTESDETPELRAKLQKVEAEVGELERQKQAATRQSKQSREEAARLQAKVGALDGRLSETEGHLQEALALAERAKEVGHPPRFCFQNSVCLASHKSRHIR